MTEQQEQSIRQRAIAHVAKVRKRLNPQTAEHIAHASMDKADEELRDYAEYLGWKQIKHLQEDASRAEHRPSRSGKRNASGRFSRARSILSVYYSVGAVSKQLGDMTPTDLSVVVSEYDRRSSEMADERDRLRAVLEEAEHRGVKKIKQLGAESVEELYREAVNHA